MPKTTPTPRRETRFLPSGGLKVERRADGEDAPPTITGHAAVFNEWTTLYESKYFVWREKLRPGCFRNALAEQQDCRALFNHDPNFVLGRTASGTLRLSEDATGLACEIDPPDTMCGRDLLESLRRGDISGMSFGFTVRAGGDVVTIREDPDGRTIEEREITDVDLFDVSPVTYPAYPQTDCQIRSAGECRERDLCSRRASRRLHNERLIRLALAD